MDASSILVNLRHAGLSVRINGDKIRLEPAGLVTPEVIELVRRNKPGMLEVLAQEQELPQSVLNAAAVHTQAPTAAAPLPPARLFSHPLPEEVPSLLPFAAVPAPDPGSADTAARGSSAHSAATACRGETAVLPPADFAGFVAPVGRHGRRLVFDIECDSLTPTFVWCIAIQDLDSGERWLFSIDRHADGSPAQHDGGIEEGLALLTQATVLVGHNVIAFDLAVLERLYGWRPRPGTQVLDTLLAAQIAFSGIKEEDEAAVSGGGLPAAMAGRHSLEAWGHRLGLPKGDPGGSWEVFTQALARYCMQDTAVCAALYRKLTADDLPRQALALEHVLAPILRQMTERGFAVDMDKMRLLEGRLRSRAEELHAQCAGLFPPWRERQPDFVPARSNRSRGYRKGVPVERWKERTFNPGSRCQVADRLIAVCGWKPEQFTETGRPVVDEEVLRGLPFPEAQLLADHFEVAKHLGMVAEGESAWAKLIRRGTDGMHRLHASIHQCGALSGRASHSRPNLAQVPRGREFREIFIASAGKTLVGADLQSIELRALAHYVNDPEFTASVVSGSKEAGTDPHTRNQQAVGLKTRDAAKTMLYAYLYGAGDGKLGSIFAADMGLTGLSPARLKQLGRQARERLMAGTPGLAALTRQVQGTFKARGYLVGIDGRHLHPRTEHAALNTLLQGAGAVIAKKWLVLAAATTAWRAQLVAWVHDEIQAEAHAEDAEAVGFAFVEAACAAAGYFELKCPISATFKIGRSWADTH